MSKKTLIRIPYMNGVQGDAAITFFDATFSTKDGILKYYPDGIFGEWLIMEIFKKHKFAVKKGLFHKTYLCPFCGQELNIEAKHTVETEHQLRLKQLPPFTIRISVPSVECTNCHLLCGVDLDGRTSSNLADAIINAFDSQNIKP